MKIKGQETSDWVAGKNLLVNECCDLMAVVEMQAHLYASWVTVQLSADTKSPVDTKAPATTGVQSCWTSIVWKMSLGIMSPGEGWSLDLTPEKAVGI